MFDKMDVMVQQMAYMQRTGRIRKGRRSIDKDGHAAEMAKLVVSIFNVILHDSSHI